MPGRDHDKRLGPTSQLTNPNELHAILVMSLVWLHPNVAPLPRTQAAVCKSLDAGRP